MDLSGMFLSAAVLLYGLAASFSVRYFKSWDLALDEKTAWWLRAAFFFHSLALILRWVETGFPPITGFSGVLSVLAFCLAGSLLAARLRASLPVLSTLFLPLVFGFSLAAFLAARPLMAPLNPELRTPLMAVHIFLLLMGYSHFTLGFGVGVAYWVQERRIKLHRIGKWGRHLPALDVLDRLTVHYNGWGLAFWAGGVLLGVLNAFRLSEKIPLEDPKVISAALVCAVYAAYFLFRGGMKFTGRKSLYLGMAGYLLAIFTLLGVRLFLTTQHVF